MTKDELDKRMLILTARLQRDIEDLEELEGYRTPFSNGHLKKRCVAMKYEVDKYLNRVFSIDEEGQKQMFTIVNTLVKNYKVSDSQLFEQIEIQM